MEGQIGKEIYPDGIVSWKSFFANTQRIPRTLDNHQPGAYCG
jgi:hypothetical protein